MRYRKRINCTLVTLLFLVFFVGIFVKSSYGRDRVGGGELEDAILAYADSDFVKAWELASKHLDDPTGRLIHCFCQIYVKKFENIKHGLAGLKDIYEDKQLDVGIRAEAGLSYGRRIQIFHIRKKRPEYDDVDLEALYKDIIALDPDSAKACYAAMYLCEMYFQGIDGLDKNKLFPFLENFLDNYKGQERETLAVHLIADHLYIEANEDYVNSYRHLKAAYDIGIKKALLRRKALFRLGRICDVKLNKVELARKYYERFLELYPNAKKTPIVVRHLAKLNERVMKASNSHD